MHHSGSGGLRLRAVLQRLMAQSGMLSLSSPVACSGSLNSCQNGNPKWDKRHEIRSRVAVEDIPHFPIHVSVKLNVHDSGVNMLMLSCRGYINKYSHTDQ